METLFADETLDINEEISNKAKRAKKKGKDLKRDKVRDLDWPKVAEIMSNGRTSSECLRRYNKIVGNRATEAACALKGPWTSEEDNKLMGLVKQNGPKKWSQIAAELPGKMADLCYDMFVQGSCTVSNHCGKSVLTVVTSIFQDALESNVVKDGTIT